MNNLTKQLKALRTIEPDEHFVAAARRGILAMPGYRDPAWKIFPLWAAEFAMLALSIVTATSTVRSNRALLTVENPETLSQELNNLSINVELEAITYHQTVNQTIASALNEIASNKMRHLNQELLQSERQRFDIPVGQEDNSKIDTLLDKVIF